MMKRILTLFLSVTMLLLAGMGCTSKSDPATTPEASPSAAVATTSQTEVKAPTKIVALIWPPTSYKPSDPAVLEEIKKIILKEANVDLEYIVGPIDGTEFQTKLNLMLAGNDQLDIAEGYWEPMQAKGMLAELTDSVKNYGQEIVKAWGEENFKPVTDKDGKIWALPRMPNFVTYPIFVRSDWLKKVGMSAPTTIEELQKVAVAFRDADPAGSGKTIPIITTLAHSRMALSGAFIQNGWSQFKDADGLIKPPYMNAGYKDFTQTLANWYKDGLLAKESFAYKTSDIVDLIKSNRVGITALWYSRVTLNEGTLQQMVPDANYQLCSIKGPAGIAETADYVMKLPSPGSGATSGTSCYQIFKSCKDVDAAVRLFNWGFTEKNYLVSKYGLEGKGFQITSTNPIKYKVLVDQAGDEINSIFKGPGNETRYMPSDSPIQRHWDYLCLGEAFNMARAKKPFDGDVKYDSIALNNAVPTYPDIQRIVDESFVEFVTGGRSMDDFGKFYTDLESADINSLIKEITRQYNEATK